MSRLLPGTFEFRRGYDEIARQYLIIASKHVLNEDGKLTETACLIRRDSLTLELAEPPDAQHNPSRR